MKTSYKKLWIKLAELEWSKKKLREETGISTTTLAKLGKGCNVNTDVLLKICETLHCDIGDIVSVVPEESKECGLSEDE